MRRDGFFACVTEYLFTQEAVKQLRGGAFFFVFLSIARSATSLFVVIY